MKYWVYFNFLPNQLLSEIKKMRNNLSYFLLIFIINKAQKLSGNQKKNFKFDYVFCTYIVFKIKYQKVSNK